MKRAWLTPVWLVMFALGCAGHRQLHLRPALVTVHVAREAGLNDTQKQQAANLCFMGMPVKHADTLGPTEYIFRDGYVLEHSSLDKIPLWVCEHVRKEQLGTDTTRSNLFKPDAALHGPKSTLADYKHSGYDRGHQAPAGNQGKNQTLQNETFFLSNMAPQFSQLNSNAWKSLEELSRTWVTRYAEAYELTGPIFYDPKEDSPATADGTVPYITIGAGVAVPTHFYKIVIVKDAGVLKAIAFVMPNIRTYKSPYRLEQYLQSVQWIEDHTGLDFMPGLAAAQRVQLEKDKSPMWP